MADETRRDFLKLLATSAALGAVPASIRAALATPPARSTGTIADVQHVVILMQENRSFDHYLGTLRGVRGFGDPRTPPLPGGGDMWRQPLSPGSGDSMLPFHLDTRRTAAQCLHDIDHRWKGSHKRWKDHDEWIREKGPDCMGYFTRDDLPFYYALADAFTVCDAYYSSIQGPTRPNRLHLVSGTSGLTVGNDGEQVVSDRDDRNLTADPDQDAPAFAGFEWTTYAERLQAAGVSWRVYQEHDNFGNNSLSHFRSFRGLDRHSELYRRGRGIAAGSNRDNAKFSRGQFLVAEFRKDVIEGSLPAVSWIVAPYALCEHPKASPAYGQSLVSRLLAVLAASPDVWSRTVFLVNYDENGGFFDHIPPPIPATHPALGKSTVDTSTEVYHGQPVGLGIRVPMFVVSPWSTGGWVDSEVFDHTSVIRFLEARFGVHEPNISAWRRTVAGDLTSTLDFASRDRAWPTLPDTRDYIAGADLACGLPAPAPASASAPPRQERGGRPARPLPYAGQVHAEVDARALRLALSFRNQGAAGMVFNVYTPSRTDGPRYFTLGPGTSVSERWRLAPDAGRYEMHVHGPNGFLRVFSGDASATSGGANPEVRVDYDPAGDVLRLVLRNTGDKPCTLALRPNHYRDAPPSRHEIPPRGETAVAWPLADSHHWYDLSVTSDADPRFLRRIAGHVETGRPAVSDPAIGA